MLTGEGGGQSQFSKSTMWLGFRFEDVIYLFKCFFKIEGYSKGKYLNK